MAKLLTATEFARLSPDHDRPQELVAGVVVERPVRFPFNGMVCGSIARHLANHVEANDLGRVMLISGVITTRDPDSVRGIDVSYYSFARLPRGPLPEDGYSTVLPELAVEVIDARDQWSQVLAKVAELLAAGATAVCVVETANGRATVYRNDRPPEAFAADAELVLPDVLPGFRVPLRQFFE